MDEYYNYIADAYNELHELEQKKKLELVKNKLKISKETKLLDVGCGTGTSSQFECDVTGIDTSDELLKIAGKRFPHIQFMKTKAEELPFENNFFDVVVSLTAMQNFSNIEKALNEIKRVGKSTFALSYLKKSEKAQMIEKLLASLFPNAEKIEEEKDVIFIVKEK